MRRINNVVFAKGLRCKGKTDVSTALNAVLKLYAGKLARTVLRGRVSERERVYTLDMPGVRGRAIGNDTGGRGTDVGAATLITTTSSVRPATKPQTVRPAGDLPKCIQIAIDLYHQSRIILLR